MYKTVWRTLKEVLKESKLVTIIFLIFAQFSNLSGLVLGYISKLYLDSISNFLTKKVTFEFATKSIIIITIGALLFYVFNTLLDAAYDYVWGYWKVDTYKRLRLKYILMLKDLPLPVYESESVGRVQEKIGAGSNSKIDIVNSLITSIFPEIVLASVAIPILFRKNSTLALIGLCGLPVFVLVRYFMFKRVKPHLVGARKAGEDYSAIENELFHQIKIIKAFNKSDFQYNYLKDKAELQSEESISVNAIYRFYNIFSRFAVQIPRAIAVGMGAYLAIKGKLTPGDVMLFSTYLGSVTQPLWNVSRALNNLQEQTTKAERLDEFMVNQSEFIGDPEKNVKNVNDKIIFDNVTYSYENKRIVLKGLNLTIEKDKVTALVGPSGVGKSTVVKLLLRFIEPTKGKVTIGDTNLNIIPKKQIRNMIGLVFQDSLLFNNTVSNNIKFGKTSAKKEEVIKAAKNANAHDFIIKLPKQYNTIVGERGVKLSGGEQQRINLARAILKNPPILILDEATSSLDAENEKIIQDALWKLIKNRTTIIIAHRLSTVKKADKIVFLKDGKVAEEGTHYELMQKKGLYYQHFQMQGAGMLEEDDKTAKVG